MATKTQNHGKTRDKQTIYMECRLTQDEVRAAAKTLADAIQRKDGVEARIEAFKTQAKADLAEIDAAIQRNSVLVNSEKEFRNVLCMVEFDWDNGVKTFFREDTGEQVKQERIAEQERQMHFTA